ncbi:MAG: glucans biosynthesis glucosyltransferase MdoH [Hyphomicrobiaceae bacterium]|nr:glucans biosynthesis glucosyltransferase MdoH [Hyphomicrobiaceae bacterium]
MHDTVAADAREPLGTGASLAGVRDASDPALLPTGAPMAMPAQDFWSTVEHDRQRKRATVSVVATRTAVFGGAALLTAMFAAELYDVLSVAEATPLQIVFLVLSTLAFGWIALGSMSAALGFFSLVSGDRPDTIELPDAAGPLVARTALLFPVYHEEPASIAGTIEAIANDLESRDRANVFDVFILSDTRGDDKGAAEEEIYRNLAERLRGIVPVYYRRRLKNAARKSGNIKDWVERFGAAYPHFVILDADSVMSGETLVRLARAMERDPRAGLIQTVPRLTGGSTLLQRLQQFAAHVYGPIVASGLAVWHREEGNYWGHNAIIRTAAFASSAGLPELAGRAPFGGHIQSHDFVEAVLLQRAGYGVHMAPTLDGSYEGLPPTLSDLVVRDRRWAQGNLQHLSIVAANGLTTMGRVHLFMGAVSYLASAIWAASLVVGVLLAIQSQNVLPNYFPESRSLFPIWPEMDPGAAARLFLGTMGVVLLPKLLGLILEIRRSQRARETLGAVRATAGVLLETVFSMMLAPILMLTQTVAVTEIFLRRDSGWNAQTRANGEVRFADALRFHAPHMALGVVTAVISFAVAPALVLWMSPVLLGLLLAAPIGWLVSREASPALSAVLSTPEDRDPPSILRHVYSATASWRLRAADLRLEAANDQSPVMSQDAAA